MGVGGALGQKRTSTHFYCIKQTLLLYHLIRHFQRQTQEDPKESPKYNRLAASGQEKNDGRWKDLGFCLGWWHETKQGHKEQEVSQNHRKRINLFDLFNARLLLKWLCQGDWGSKENGIWASAQHYIVTARMRLPQECDSVCKPQSLKRTGWAKGDSNLLPSLVPYHLTVPSHPSIRSLMMMFEVKHDQLHSRHLEPVIDKLWLCVQVSHMLASLSVSWANDQ